MYVQKYCLKDFSNTSPWALICKKYIFSRIRFFELTPRAYFQEIPVLVFLVCTAVQCPLLDVMHHTCWEFSLFFCLDHSFHLLSTLWFQRSILLLVWRTCWWLQSYSLHSVLTSIFASISFYILLWHCALVLLHCSYVVEECQDVC